MSPKEYKYEMGDSTKLTLPEDDSGLSQSNVDGDVESLIYYVDSVLADQSMTDSPIPIEALTSRDVGPTLILNQRHDTRMVLNIGGNRFTTLRSTLQNVPNTRLAKLNEMDPSYDPPLGEYFFDRNPKFFASILDFYRSGELHFSHCLCGPSIKRELDFWCIDEAFIAACCWRSYKTFEDEQKTLQTLQHTLDDPELMREAEERSRQERMPTSSHCVCCASKWEQYRHTIWTFLDKPTSSRFAQVSIATNIYI